MIRIETWSAPGSLLIAGEYLVTEEGGKGICLAAGRATMKKERSNAMELRSIYAGGFQSWKPDSSVKDSLCYFAWEEAGKPNSRFGRGWRITVDTSALYASDGQKLGLGSSAVAVLLFSKALSHAADNSKILASAVLAHRKWQGGRGSGYGILTSARGGAGCFEGGLFPSWNKLNWPKLQYWLLRGPTAIGSAQALRRYETWKEKLGKHWLDIPLLASYHSCLLETISILVSETTDAWIFLEKLHELATLSSELGSAINQESMPLMPVGFSRSKKPWYRPGAATAKSLGAGNEIVLLAGLEDGFTKSEQSKLEELQRAGRAFPLSIEGRGLSRELPR